MATIIASVPISGGLPLKSRDCLSTRSNLFGSTMPLTFQQKLNQQKTKRSLSVCAEYGDQRGGSGGDFIAGFLMGSALFGTLAYVFAPQHPDFFAFRGFKRIMMAFASRFPTFLRISSFVENQFGLNRVELSLPLGKCTVVYKLKDPFPIVLTANAFGNSSLRSSPIKNIKPSKDFNAAEKKVIKKVGKQEHHLWSKRDSSGSGQKALNLVRIVSRLPNEKEAVYGALDKWTAWEPEFPLIAAAKALQILKKRNQWTRVIQVAKWMLGKGQGMTMGTFDTLLLAFDMDGRVDEAESFWNMILHTHTRSMSKRLFSRMICLYDHHNNPDKIIEVFADMEELGVKPDEDTTRKVAHAFRKQGQEDKQKEVIKKYLGRWKYIHFEGERVKVKRALWNE